MATAARAARAQRDASASAISSAMRAEELGAHAGMKAVAIGAAEREQARASLCLPAARAPRSRCSFASAAEQQLALRIPHLAAAGLAAGEQGFEGLQAGIVRGARVRTKCSPASSAPGVPMSSSMEWNASKSSRRLASTCASTCLARACAQQAAREAVQLVGDGVVGAGHAHELGELLLERRTASRAALPPAARPARWWSRCAHAAAAGARAAAGAARRNPDCAADSARRTLLRIPRAWRGPVLLVSSSIHAPAFMIVAPLDSA